jgi:hypothetical protein
MTVMVVPVPRSRPARILAGMQPTEDSLTLDAGALTQGVALGKSELRQARGAGW